MYQLKTVADFDSAHFLSGYQGKCANIHGHRWHVEIEIQAEHLEMQGQMRGMLVDFGDLKRDLKKLADEFDHTLIYETAENFSRYFFDRMCGSGYPVSCATVYETPNNCAIYRRDQ